LSFGSFLNADMVGGTNIQRGTLVRSSIAKATAALVIASTCATSAALADKGCKNIQSKCAIQIGGRCDPITGHWEYGRDGAGGNTMAFNDCVSKATQNKK
jgi:hypothetical protein